MRACLRAHRRLELLKDFVRFGLEHWGSDDIGVARVRKFLLEWLSFLHRYVLPARIISIPRLACPRVSLMVSPFSARACPCVTSDLPCMRACVHPHRYVPVGLLEVLPARMQDRPPAYFARNELETLMASSNAADWVKITEMLLGPCPDNYSFTPKHKANAHSTGPIQAEG